MLKFIYVVTLPIMLSVTVFAANPHVGGATGQPTCNCAATPATPGSSASAPGSAFNTSGVSGTKYAGQQTQNSKNPKSVSQYDAACFQQFQH